MTRKRYKFFNPFGKKKIRYQLLNPKKKLIVIFFHGFMSNIEGEKPSRLSKFCIKKKIGFLTFEYTGHGKSSGKFVEGNISKWTHDAKQIIKAKTSNKKKLIFIGSSMGSWIALNLFPSFKKQIKGFIGISSAPEFLEELMWKKFSKKIKKIIMKERIYNIHKNGWTYPITKQIIVDGRKNKVLNNRINLKIPLTLFHSSKDAVVPLNYSKKILNFCNNSKKKFIKIKSGNHSLSRKSDLNKICKELNQMIMDIS